MTPHPLMYRPITRGAIAVLVAATLVAACGDDDDSNSTDQTSPAADDTSVPADGNTTSAVGVTDAWARTSPSATTAGAVYMQIGNTGDTDDALVAVAVDPSVAAMAEIHETTMVETDSTVGADTMPMDTTPADMSSDTTAGDGGMMTMRPVDRIVVPAGGAVSLEPGGYHVMLLDLTQPLTAGGVITLTLTFEVAGEQVVTADVRDTNP